jgi:uncharacterized protein (TIGR02145 family)
MAKCYPERIFLCHAHEDGRRVQKTYSRLQAAGLSPWIDRRDIPPASEWDGEIQRNLQAARFVIVFLSTQLLGKSEGYVQKEIELALTRAKERVNNQLLVLIATLDSSDIPSTFDDLTSVDLTDAGGDERLAELIKEELYIFTDPRDGQMYRTLRIGDYVWFAENLRYECEGSWCYNHERRREEVHGRLYMWDAARRACPPGWRVPSDEEWGRLATEFGGYCDMDCDTDESDGAIVKGSKAFESLITGGRSGFDASLSGLRDSRGRFKEFGRGGYYWTSSLSEFTTNYGNFEEILHWKGKVDDETYKKLASYRVETAWFYYFYTLSGLPQLRRGYQFPLERDPRPFCCGLSVRCLKDLAVAG